MSPAAAFVDTGKASDCLMGSDVGDESSERQFQKEQSAYSVEEEIAPEPGRRQGRRCNSPLRSFPAGFCYRRLSAGGRGSPRHSGGRLGALAQGAVRAGPRFRHRGRLEAICARLRPIKEVRWRSACWGPLTFRRDYLAERAEELIC